MLQRTLETYTTYRTLARDVNSRIMNTCLDQATLWRAARFLSLVQGTTFVFESESEMSALMDFALHDCRTKGKNAIERYCATVGETTQPERELLDALRTATTSLFRVLKLSGPEGTLLLEDLLEHKEPIELTDVGFSHSAEPGYLLFVRLIALPTLTMTSGAGFVFPAELERDLLRRYTKLIKKRGPESLAIRRFVAFFGWNRTLGIEVLFE